MSNANPHLQTPLAVYGAPARRAELAVILVHGRAQSPQWMHETIVRRIDLPDVAWFAPAAAEGSWYPARFFEPLERNEPWLGHALERLDTLSEQLRIQGFPFECQVLMGFSQGACLSCEYLWRRRRRYAALVAFTGGLIGPPDTPRHVSRRDLQGMPVLLSTWEQDPWVPAERVRASAELFAALGADVTLKVEPGSEHGIRDSEIAYARTLLADSAEGSNPWAVRSR